METQALTWLWGSPGRDLACLHQGALAGYCQQGEAEHRLQAQGGPTRHCLLAAPPRTVGALGSRVLASGTPRLIQDLASMQPEESCWLPPSPPDGALWGLPRNGGGVLC